MALTLPYPSMVFVPLDILTAEEMNELVSNIEYISNQFPLASAALASNSITTDKIANGAVTSDKIDFETLDWSEFAPEILTQGPIAVWQGSSAYSTNWYCERYGNIVVNEISGFPNASMPASGASTEKAPVGYRPTRTEVGVLRSSLGSSGMVGVGRMNADGTFGWWLPQANNTNEITFRITYITNDQWPSN